MAPDKPRSKPLSYPHITPVGIITSPVSSERVWDTLEETPLSEAEKQLVTSLVKATTKKYSKSSLQQFIKSYNYTTKEAKEKILAAFK